MQSGINDIATEVFVPEESLVRSAPQWDLDVGFDEIILDDECIRLRGMGSGKDLGGSIGEGGLRGRIRRVGWQQSLQSC